PAVGIAASSSPSNWGSDCGRTDIAWPYITETSTATPDMRPRVVALGGGHGLSVALRAIREYAGESTAVVSVADDGGSSGRLRRDFDVPAPGDLRRCLVALASEDGAWPAAFEYRFGWGELAGHALGNLMLVGLAATLGDLTAALAEAGRMRGADGRGVPARPGTVPVAPEIGAQGVGGQLGMAG